MPKLRNIIIFISIALVIVLVYVFFIKSPSQDTAENANLVTTTPAGAVAPVSGTATDANASAKITGDFLTLLLNVKNIKLDDSIFADPAFLSLHDSTITLTEDPSQEGRANPFAQIGTDAAAPAQDAASVGAPLPPASSRGVPKP
jgi:hypothetical protein